MIDLANYKRAIQWLQRGMAKQAREPENEMLRDGLLHSFEVTHNITESILRQALSRISDDVIIPGLSSRELMRFAADEGLPVSSPQAWLQYGLAIERANETLDGEAFSQQILPLLPQYTQELEAFAIRLKAREVPNA